MTKKTRRHHTPDQKINMLRRHHLDKVPVSEVCEGAALQPSVFYCWQRHLFEYGSAAESNREQDLQAEVGSGQVGSPLRGVCKRSRPAGSRSRIHSARCSPMCRWPRAR